MRRRLLELTPVPVAGKRSKMGPLDEIIRIAAQAEIAALVEQLETLKTKCT